MDLLSLLFINLTAAAIHGGDLQCCVFLNEPQKNNLRGRGGEKMRENRSHWCIFQWEMTWTEYFHFTQLYTSTPPNFRDTCRFYFQLFYSITFIWQLLLQVTFQIKFTFYNVHMPLLPSENHVSPNLVIVTLNFSDKWKDNSVVWKFEKSMFTIFCECCFYCSLPVNSNFLSPVGKMNRWLRGPTRHIEHFHVD